MARLPRITVPGVAHHVTQRGNRREAIFWQADDYALYRDLLAQQCAANAVAVWAYCLMPNHVHLILVPCDEDGLSRAIGETHRRYTGYINARLRVTGHLFQGRFGSVAMNETHLLAAFRYVAMNPVKAQLVRQPRDWPWASTQAHLAARDDELVSVQPLIDRVDDVAQFLSSDSDPELEQALVKGQSVGRPLMDENQLIVLEQQMQRRLRPAPRGRPRTKGDE